MAFNPFAILQNVANVTMGGGLLGMAATSGTGIPLVDSLLSPFKAISSAIKIVFYLIVALLVAMIVYKLVTMMKGGGDEGAMYYPMMY